MLWYQHSSQLRFKFGSIFDQAFSLEISHDRLKDICLNFERYDERLTFQKLCAKLRKLSRKFQPKVQLYKQQQLQKKSDHDAIIEIRQNEMKTNQEMYMSTSNTFHTVDYSTLLKTIKLVFMDETLDDWMKQCSFQFRTEWNHYSVIVAQFLVRSILTQNPSLYTVTEDNQLCVRIPHVTKAITGKDLTYNERLECGTYVKKHFQRVYDNRIEHYVKVKLEDGSTINALQYTLNDLPDLIAACFCWLENTPQISCSIQ